MSILTESIDMINEIKYINKKEEYTSYELTDQKIDNVNICIDDENKTGKLFPNLEKDLPIMKKEYKKWLNGEFKKWLKLSDIEFKDLKLYAIEYDYRNNKSRFEFCYEYHFADDNGKLTSQTCPVAMVLTVENGTVSKDSFHDI